MKVIGVIPARYQSSRLPGKPLADICGRPMIWWTYQVATRVPELAEIWVATDSEKIRDVCQGYRIPVLMTSESHPTGTDRVAEVAQQKPADLYVVLMGDEPQLRPEFISQLIRFVREDGDVSASMLASAFKNPVDVVNSSTIKLAITENNDLIFMSRSAIPFPKADLGFSYYKNIGAYVFRKEALDFFLQTPPGRMERAEEIELLRLLEHHKKIKAHIVDSDSMSVDCEKDLLRSQDAILHSDRIRWLDEDEMGER